MARLLLPPLSSATDTYVQSITGRSAVEFDPTALSPDQLEQLHFVLEAEVEFAQEQIQSIAKSLAPGETEDDPLRLLVVAVAEIAQLLAGYGR